MGFARLTQQCGLRGRKAHTVHSANPVPECKHHANDMHNEVHGPRKHPADPVGARHPMELWGKRRHRLPNGGGACALVRSVILFGVGLCDTCLCVCSIALPTSETGKRALSKLLAASAGTGTRNLARAAISGL